MGVAALRVRAAGVVLGRLLLFAAAGAGPAQAQLIAAEGFVYPLGTTIAPWAVAGQDGGSGWMAPWGNNGGVDMVAVAGLTYPGLRSSGGAAYNPGYDWSGNGLEPAVSTTVRQFYWAADTPDLWVSFLLRPDDSAYAFEVDAWAGLSVYSGTGVFIGKPGTVADASYSYALQDGVTYASAAGAPGPEALRTDLLVAHLVAGDPGAGRAELWVNPVLGLPLGTPDATRDDLTLVNGAAVYVNLNSRGFYTTDELRLGTNVGDALPVPAPMVLLACGLAALLAAHRRPEAQGPNCPDR